MFEQSSPYYDLIYGSFKDYAAEAAQIRQYIQVKHPACRSILDVACGTAEHAKFLKEHFQLDGIDLNEQMLAIARVKNPECRYVQADMTDFRVDRKYDVVMCLFSSIGYVRTLENVGKTLRQFSEHLHDGGVILLEPWLTPEATTSGWVSAVTVEKDGVKICRMSHTGVQDSISVLTFEYLIGSQQGIRHLREEHRLGLFTVDQLIQAFQESGLKVEFDPEGISGRGMYIARK